MKKNIFREYDIRGIVGEEFTIEDSHTIARSIATYFLQNNPNLKTIAIGYDGRTHSPLIKKQVFKAITEMGLNIVDIGLCPTPVFYFTLFNTEVTTGFIITASHNPKQYNGFKICQDKKSVWGAEIQKIRALTETPTSINSQPITGTITSIDTKSMYIKWMETSFEHLKNSPIRAVIDCGNGAAGSVIPDLVKAMGWKNVNVLCSEVDGNFPNHEADPTSIKNMQCVLDALKEDPRLELGLGLDGDCDRMNPMTRHGYLIPGDQMLALYSKSVVKNHPGAPVVFDIKSSLGLVEVLKSIGAKDCISPSGHSLIKNAMVKNNALLAGELSCHFFFKDRYFGYDDGIYAIMRLFELVQEKPLEDHLQSLPKKISSREFRIPCDEDKKVEVIDSVKNFFATKVCNDVITIDGIRTHMDYGWGLARASNTQAVICLRFESDTNDNLKKIKHDFVEALSKHYSQKALEDEIEL